MFGGYIIPISITLLVVSALSNYFLYQDNLEISKELNSTKIVLGSKIEEINNINKQLDSELINNKKLQDSIYGISDQYTITIQQLNKMKNRESTIIKRPSLVELKINKSFDKFSKEMSCISGVLANCEGDLE